MSSDPRRDERIRWSALFYSLPFIALHSFIHIPIRTTARCECVTALQRGQCVVWSVLIKYTYVSLHTTLVCADREH